MKITTDTRVSRRHDTHKSPSIDGDAMLTMVVDQLMKVVVTKATPNAKPDAAAPRVGGAGHPAHRGNDPHGRVPLADATTPGAPGTAPAAPDPNRSTSSTRASEDDDVSIASTPMPSATPRPCSTP